MENGAYGKAVKLRSYLNLCYLTKSSHEMLKKKTKTSDQIG